VDWGLLCGSISTFGLLFLLFLRFLPAIPIFEVKELRREMEAHGPGAPHEGPGAGEVRR
jgi:molybdopterin-containing oxidoreductase family membrane subunit